MSRKLPVMVLALLTAHPGSVLSQQRAFAFLTSSTGTADLGSWPEAAGETGVEAGNSVCRTQATAGGLSDPDTYIAWLSTSQDDVWCRVRGLTGKRADNCGVIGELPIVGPWHRTDGRLFLDVFDSGPDIRRVFRAVDVDETGAVIDDPLLVGPWTATWPNGALSPAGACDDWTSASAAPATMGWPNRTTWDWSGDLRLVPCSEQGRLICIQPIAAAPDRPRDWGRDAFLSVAVGNGDLSTWSAAGGNTGIAAGDAICAAEAEERGLVQPERVRAWLSDSRIDAASRFEWNGPWARLDGVRVADDLADLTDGRLQTSINVQSDGVYQVGVTAFTGTTADGMLAATHCLDWTSADPAKVGIRGRTNAVQDHWSQHLFGGPQGAPCQFPGRLYCLSDSDQLFADSNEWPMY